MSNMNYIKYILLVVGVVAIIALPVGMLIASASDSAAVETAVETQNSDILPLPVELSDFDSGLKANEYTPDTYVELEYDPFSNKHYEYSKYEELIESGDRGANTAPTADFRIRTKDSNLADFTSGTTATEFIFDAYASNDSETKGSYLQVRWDFESDSEYDSFFSRSKTARHKFEEQGQYLVTLEVMDAGGLISTKQQVVNVVENTPPYAYVMAKTKTATKEKIFSFDTSKSYDSQYNDRYLEYRFDWDGDGIWDTAYKQKTVWNHKFEESGVYKVVLEAKDPQGAVANGWVYITVTDNLAPTASFNVTVKQERTGTDKYRNRYYFDASGSTDPEYDANDLIQGTNNYGLLNNSRNNNKLQYRWDFNYTGENDISYDTSFSTSPKYSGTYDIPGEKIVRLEVKDEDGATSVAYARVII